MAKNKKPKTRLTARPPGDPKIKAAAEQKERARLESRRTITLLIVACVLIVLAAIGFYYYKFGPAPKPENNADNKAAANSGTPVSNEPAPDPRAAWTQIEAFMSYTASPALAEAAAKPGFADSLPLGYGASPDQWREIGVVGFSGHDFGAGDFQLEAGEAEGSWTLTFNSANTMGYGGTHRPPTGTVSLTNDGTWSRTGAAHIGE